jgi:hypothetical protein
MILRLSHPFNVDLLRQLNACHLQPRLKWLENHQCEQRSETNRADPNCSHGSGMTESLTDDFIGLIGGSTSLVVGPCDKCHSYEKDRQNYE